MITGHLSLAKAIRITHRLGHPFRRLGHEMLELLCPPTCTLCRTEIPDSRDVLCQKCWEQFRENLVGQYCTVCGHDTGPYALIEGRCHRCQNRRPVVSRMVRVGRYHGPLRDMILAFKFRQQSHLDLFLGSLLAAAVLGDPEISQADLLIPIPLHWRRLWSRKYNQAELLTRVARQELTRHENTIAINCDLLRVRYTRPQSSMAPSHRLINLRHAFAARPDAHYAGKHICLIDDVTTTGTTLRVAAQTLKKAGAARISAAVLAVAAND